MLSYGVVSRLNKYFLADSGISDTEDEEKSSEKVSELAALETNDKSAETGESSTSNHQVTNTEPVQAAAEPNNVVADTNAVEQPPPDIGAEKMSQPDTTESHTPDTADDSKLEDSHAPVIESAAEEPRKSETEEQSVPADQQTEELTGPTETAKPALVSETPISDKKRPLEEDEEDQEPGAKQPRMYSPDKVRLEHQTPFGNH